MAFVQATALADMIENKAEWSGRDQLADQLRALGADTAIPVVADSTVSPSGTYDQAEVTQIVTDLNAVIDALQALGLVSAT